MVANQTAKSLNDHGPTGPCAVSMTYPVNDENYGVNTLGCSDAVRAGVYFRFLHLISACRRFPSTPRGMVCCTGMEDKSGFGCSVQALSQIQIQ
jgi:hypothetical protein